MTGWQLRTTARFDRAARKLDRQILRRIKAYLDEVCLLDDPRLRGKPLTAGLSGYWCYRIGDWRVVAEIRESELIVLAIGLGHRSEICEKD